MKDVYILTKYTNLAHLLTGKSIDNDHVCKDTKSLI